MVAFQTSDCNTHGYYIVKWTGNAYTLQEKYKCHAFDPPVIIPEDKIVCPAKFEVHPCYCIQSHLLLPEACLARQARL